MPGLAEVRLLEEVVVAAAGHEEVLAQEGARDTGDLGMEEHLPGELLRGDEGVAVAGGEIVAAAVEALVDDAVEDDHTRGDEVHDAVVVQGRFNHEDSFS